MDKQKPRIVKVGELEIDLDRIQNPKLRRVFRRRIDNFMFFGNSSHFSNKHTDKAHTDHTDHQDEHKESYGDYTERSTHTDVTCKNKEDKHIDYTDHSEEAHDEHSEYQDYNVYDDYIHDDYVKSINYTDGG